MDTVKRPSPSNTDGEDNIRQMVINQMHADGRSMFDVKISPTSAGMPPQLFQTKLTGIFDPDFFLHDINEIVSGNATAEFIDQNLLTDFAGEPYRVLKAIPANVRSLDAGEGFEASFVDGNIAWVADSRAEAINGLKAEILDTLEDLEDNEYRLGPEPKRQLALLRKHLEHTP